MFETDELDVNPSKISRRLGMPRRDQLEDSLNRMRSADQAAIAEIVEREIVNPSRNEHGDD